MSIESELKKDGIEVVRKLDTLSVNALAHDIAEKFCETFPKQNFLFQSLFIALSRIPMYIANIPDGYAEATYFYKNSSIYFKSGVPIDELKKAAVHEFIHYLQEIKDNSGNLVKLGLCDFGDLKIQGLALNEGAVQLMASKVLKQDQEIVKYYGISLPTTSPNYYPILCNLVAQMGYIVGEDILCDSTFYGTNAFKNNFANLCGLNALIKIENNLDKILNIEEKIVKLNQKLVADNCEGSKAKKISKKINIYKENLKSLYFNTQDLIYKSYFDTQFEQVLSPTDMETYRFRLYNYKNYIGITENYSTFNDYYIKKMMDLDDRYEQIVNNTAVTVVNNSPINMFFKKLKALLSARIELQ